MLNKFFVVGKIVSRKVIDFEDGRYMTAMVVRVPNSKKTTTGEIMDDFVDMDVVGYNSPSRRIAEQMSLFVNGGQVLLSGKIVADRSANGQKIKFVADYVLPIG